MGLRFARLFKTLAVMSFGGLAISCSQAGGWAGESSAIAAADHVHVVDNFNAPDLEQCFEAVAKKASATVVAISATESPIESDATLRSDDLSPEKLASVLETVDRTVGTGFIIDSDGYILTNDHVVTGAEQLWITTDSHKVYPAIVVGSDPRADLAVLKIPASHLPVAHFSTAAARRGQWTIAIGNPYGLAGGGEMAVSVGIVSAINRSLPRLSGKEDRLYSGLIQTTAQINPGNSGGPLFDLDGNVLGVNTAVILPQKQTNGIGFAIPADSHVLRVVDNLKQGREVQYGYLGVRVTSPTPHERRDAGMTDDAGGVRIESVEKDSPAAAAGLNVGDIVMQLDGHAILDSDDFVRLVGMCPVGDPVQATIYNKGMHTASIKLKARQVPQQAISKTSQRLRWRGMLLGAVPSAWDLASPKKQMPGVLVIGVDSKSTQIPEGVKAGSVITAVAGKKIYNLAELQRIINDTPASQCRLELALPQSAVVSAN
jgi:S1-C subfamily serine protease